ncbi:hypothetical protein TNIN_410691 [Trichonephila inaurata madagascariensis]|uniref:Uncharacterized protein n=1 Tax=Trichonephila inaurata madagascariensis TaxID=2747483 RepID=A0A8X7CL72_9ARAC|nr:hypothetical protein TNIN_410691 [Trichonephila inaurata madagascariensis]
MFVTLSAGEGIPPPSKFGIPPFFYFKILLSSRLRNRAHDLSRLCPDRGGFGGRWCNRWGHPCKVRCFRGRMDSQRPVGTFYGPLISYSPRLLGDNSQS